MKRLAPIYISGIFLSLHYAAILYVNSSYLSQFFSPGRVSMLFLIGAFSSIGFLFLSAGLMRLLGSRFLYVFFILLLSASTLSLGFGNKPVTIAISFILYSGFLSMVYWCLDVFLEDASTNAETGVIRGTYLTSLNAAIAIAPLLLLFLAIEEQFRLLYVASFLLLVPPLMLSLFSFRKQIMPVQSTVAGLPFGRWRRNAAVRRVTLARFVLEFFYTFMVIYTPIYLNKHVGFGWPELGIMFTIMLLPFVIIEWPAGETADRWYGEKEMMSIGFFITAGSLLLMPLIGKVFLIWTGVLFISRVGASLIEVTTESYFFKHIESKDAGLISIFRLTRPVSVAIASVIGALSLRAFAYGEIFWVLATFTILGLTQSLRLVDTK